MKFALFFIFVISMYASETVTIGNTIYQNQLFTKKINLQKRDTFRDYHRALNWKKAKEYCQNLEYQGFSDWKLPTSKELEKMLRVDIYYALGDYKSFETYTKQHLDHAKAHVESIKSKRHTSSIGSELIVNDEFLNEMPLINSKNPMGEFWVSDERDQSYAMTLDFRNALGWWVIKTREAYVLCVRDK